MTSPELEDLILEIADGNKSVSRIAREVKLRSGEQVSFQDIAALMKSRQIPLPRRVSPMFELRNGKTWYRVFPDGSRYPVTEKERAIALSEWLVPSLDSIVRSQATWWKQVRRIWGDTEASRLYNWLLSRCTKREWVWFKSQQEDLVGPLYERRAFSSRIPATWSPSPSSHEAPEELGLKLRFPYSQLRQACLDGYTREMQRNPDPQPGKPNPLPLPIEVLIVEKQLITDEEFVTRSAQQWKRLQQKLNESRLRLLRGRLAPSTTVSPASISSAQNGFLFAALREFWEGDIPEDVFQFALSNWRKARDLTLTSLLLS